MNKLIKGLLIVLAIIMLGGTLISTLYTQSVSDELTRLRRESRSDIVYLRTRIRELESELTACLLNAGNSPSEPADGNLEPAPDNIPEHQTPEAGTEAITIPTHQSPETQPPSVELPETALGEALYLLSEHNGIIGVFDAAGELLRTVNVFVMTLPDAEQEALTMGIPAYSKEELNRILKQYE